MTYQLLNSKDIAQLIASIDPVHQASIVCQYIKNKVIVQKDIIYEVKSNVIYEELIGNIDEDVLVKVSTYLSASYEKLSTSDKESLINMMINQKKFKQMSNAEKKKEKSKHQSKLSNIFLNSSIKKYIPQIKKYLTRNDIEFDKYKEQIHYINGYMCLKTLKFKQRVLGEHFITHYIKREYKPSKQSQREEIMEHIKKIYVDEGDRNIILNIIGRTMAGLSADYVKNTFLLGVGSSGKSTVMNFCKLSFECYFKELKEDAFSKGNPKRDKILNTFKYDKHILMTCVNEMIDENIDNSLFKLFIEGALQTTVLFKDKSNNVEHQSGLFFTSNTMPKLPMEDSGTKKRVEAYYHKSLFIIDKDKEHLIDESKHIFKGNKNLKKEIVEKGLLDAWADIIFERSHLLINKKIDIVYNDNFKNDKKLVEETDNPFKDFVQQELITNESAVGHLISKDDMLYAYKEFIKKPNANILNKTLIDKFRCIAKDLQIPLIYDPSGRRCKSKLTEAEASKGCWVNCRFKTENERAKEKEEDKANEMQSINESLETTEDLKKQIEDLKRLLEAKDNELKELRTGSFSFDEITIEEVNYNDKPMVEWEEVKDDETTRDYNVNDLNTFLSNY